MSRTSKHIPTPTTHKPNKTRWLLACLCLICASCGRYQLRADHQNTAITTPVHLPYIAIDAKHGINAHQMTQDLAVKLRAQGLSTLTIGQTETAQTTIRCRVMTMDILDYGSTQRIQATLKCAISNAKGPPVELHSRGQNTITNQTQRQSVWQIDRQTKQLALFDAHQQMARRVATHLRQLASHG